MTLEQDTQNAPVDRGDEVKTLADAAPEVEPSTGEQATEQHDEAQAKEDGGKEGGKDKGRYIPLDRHQKILEKQRDRAAQLERELEEYRRGGQRTAFNEEVSKRESSIQALEKKMQEQLLAGDNEKAAETMTQIRHAERELTEMKSEVRMAEVEARAIERARYDIVLERIEAAYPQLNADHEDYDESMVAEVIELQQGFVKNGRSASDALQRAVRYVLGKPETGAQRTAVEVTPRVNKDEVVAQRRTQAAEKTADTIKRTPPDTKGVGLDSDKMGGAMSNIDLAKLDVDAFAKLPEETVRKMRGDVLA